ncbi:MAG: hypothetical protein IT353_06280 [Gemmatimonadaceae bacterium]|nr:hypothetical protein [Gemmatimonadaceae bacterium]
MRAPAYVRARRGLLLPLVLIVMILASLLAAGAQHAAWRATRGSQSQWDAQRASYRAEAAVVTGLATWGGDSMAATPIGVPMRSSVMHPGDWQTDLLRMRTSATTAVIAAAARRDRTVGTHIDPSRTRRVVSRIVYLKSPRWPAVAAITSLGPIDIDSAHVDGRDIAGVYQPQRDDCGPLRDTLSLPAVAASALRTSSPLGSVADTVTLAARELLNYEIRFDSTMDEVRARVPATVHVAGPLGSLAAWRPIVIADTSGVTVRGASSHVGLLVVDGDLTIEGTLRIDGLLVVRGLLDASRGTLIVRGAVILREGAGRWARLSASSDVRYAPCVAARSMVALSVPSTKPFSLWHSP